jgi:hypothetical protein
MTTRDRPGLVLVTNRAGVSLEEVLQVLVRFLSASVAFEPQGVSKGINLGFPKLTPHDPITIHEGVDDDPVVV